MYYTQDFPIQQLKLLLWGLLSVDPPGKSIMPYVVTTKVAESGTPPSVHSARRSELVAHTHILLPDLKKHISYVSATVSPHLGLPSQSWPQVAALPELLFSCLLTLPF